MKILGLVLGWVLIGGLYQATAFANPIATVGETVAETTVTGARWTGHTVGAGITWLLVNTDKGIHWTWDVAHNKFLHPLVSTLTLGGVNL